MSGFEFNKLFAAILVAGIIASLSGFIAEKIVHPHKLDKDAVTIEGEAMESGGAAKASMPDPILHLIATADVAKGEKLSKACAACHSFEQGGPIKTGPNLWSVVGGPKAHMKSFDYSAGLEEKGGAWGYQDLNKFLWKPKKFVDGTKMNFIGLKKPEDRAALIAWLRTQGSGSFPLPSSGEIAAEAAELAPPTEEAADAPAGARAETAPAAH